MSQTPVRTCSAHDDICARVSLLRSAPLHAADGGASGVVVDRVRYPLETAGSAQPSTASVDGAAAAGVCLCYSGLLRGYGGVRSHALPNHVRNLFRPLSRIFAGDMHVAFSTAYTSRGEAAGAALLPPVRAALRDVGLDDERVVEELRPLAPVNTSNVNQRLSFLGIAHCGRLIAALARRRQRPFAYSVRMRYDLLLAPRFGDALSLWPGWHAAAGGGAAADAASAMLGVSKYILENSTSTRGLQLWGCPHELPARRCVPQDVFFVYRATAHLGPAQAPFLSEHPHALPGFVTPGLTARMHASERSLFDLLLSRGEPLDILWDADGECLWKLVDERSLDDARAPRAVFRGRCKGWRDGTREN